MTIQSSLGLLLAVSIGGFIGLLITSAKKPITADPKPQQVQPIALEIGTNGWEAKVWVEFTDEPGPLAPIGFKSWGGYQSAQAQFESRTRDITDSAAKEMIWRDILDHAKAGTKHADVK